MNQSKLCRFILHPSSFILPQGGRQAAERMNCMFSLPSRCAAALLAVSLFVGRGAGTENEKDLRKSPTVKAVQKVKPSVVSVKVTLPGSGGRTRDQTGT